MIRLILNDEQVQAVQQADDRVELCDARGTLLGYMSRPLSPELLKEIDRRLKSDGPWRTTAQVLEHLKSLES
jgi:hypothetical protein